MKCPCTPTKLYTECCKKAHLNVNSVATAEILMRSRYSAFVFANIEYLQKSHHSSTRPSKREKNEILQWTKSVVWLRLEVINSTKNTVEFKAYFIENGKLDFIHEISFFCKENEHWVYKKAE
jgi:SEC-C motif-containing protein